MEAGLEPRLKVEGRRTRGLKKRNGLLRRMVLVRRRAGRLNPNLRGLLWAISAGVTFALLNVTTRSLTLQLDPLQTQFLRYLASVVVMLPFMLRTGLAQWRPRNIGGQFLRGGLHAAGLCLWFWAMPHIPLADTTAIGFTGPIFIMLGAAWMFGERMRADRWAATLIAFVGVMIVIAPKFQGTGGGYALMMLASAPIFAASFLMIKGQTRYETAWVIVAWQAITVSVWSFPLALISWRAPSLMQYVAFLSCGILGAVGQYMLARGFALIDISAAQSVRFLDLVWAALLGWLIFADVPSHSTVLGGAVICASTFWIARREARSLSRT